MQLECDNTPKSTKECALTAVDVLAMLKATPAKEAKDTAKAIKLANAGRLK